MSTTIHNLQEVLKSYLHTQVDLDVGQSLKPERDYLKDLFFLAQKVGEEMRLVFTGPFAAQAIALGLLWDNEEGSFADDTAEEVAWGNNVNTPNAIYIAIAAEAEYLGENEDTDKVEKLREEYLSTLKGLGLVMRRDFNRPEAVSMMIRGLFKETDKIENS